MKLHLTSLFCIISNIIFSQDSVQSLCNTLASDYLKKQTGTLIIGINFNGQEKIYYYGETEKGNNVLPDDSSLYEIGNITETFTSLLYADLSLKGIVQIDDKVNDYLPISIPSQVYQPLVCRPVKTEDYKDYSEEDRMVLQFSPYICIPDSTYQPQPLLLCYLSTHTSGFPELPPGIKKNRINPYSNYSKSNLYDFLRNYHINKPIGFEYKYSETGIALLGIALSNKLQKSFENLLAENLLDTLKMFDTRITLTEDQQKHLLPGYNKKSERVSHWTYDAFAPVGGLHSNITDMMIFLAANISLKKNYYSNLLDYTHKSRLKIGGSNKDNLEIGLGWKISSIGTDTNQILWNSGQTGGFASYIGFVKSKNIGVVILSSASKDVSLIGNEILHLLEKKEIQE